MIKQASYTVIDKAEMPPPMRNEWLPIFDHLPTEKVVCFECESWKRAFDMMETIQQCCRFHRRPYQVHCRRTRDSNGTVKLYCWKEMRDGHHDTV